MTERRHDGFARTVLAFVGLGVLILVLVGLVGMVVLRRVAIDRSIESARQLTALSARIVEPRVDEGLISGDAEASVKVASIVSDAVLHPPIVAVKIWAPDGTIVYSNNLKVIGRRFTSAANILQQLSPNDVLTRLSDPSAPENQDVPTDSKLLVSYARLRMPDGAPLLFETYQRFSSVADSQQRLLGDFAPVLVVTLVAFAVLIVPLVWALARRVQRAGREREELLQRVIDASGQERRRIAGDIHDGPVHELAGLAMRVSAQSNRAADPSQRRALADTADAVRGSIRTLRSAIFGIYPPDLQAAGLGPALSDLTARFPAEGLDVAMEVADPAGYGPRVDELLYRACQEALRNVLAHARARHVAVRVYRDEDRAVLEVRDDGRGLNEANLDRARADGHVGLQILRDVIRDSDGDLSLAPVDSGGTVLRAEVPIE
ncbi:MAG: histidine kinase [Actinomycetota bacterium]|nr:histidine kinase [Actinomycetota bacterium]